MADLADILKALNLEIRTFAVFLGKDRKFLSYQTVNTKELHPLSTPRYWAGRQAAIQAGFTVSDFDNCRMPTLYVEEVLLPPILALENEISRLRGLQSEIRNHERARVRRLFAAFESKWPVIVGGLNDFQPPELHIPSLAWDDPQGEAVGALWDPKGGCFLRELEAYHGKKVEIVPPFPVEEWKDLLVQVSQGQWTLTFDVQAISFEE